MSRLPLFLFNTLTLGFVSMTIACVTSAADPVSTLALDDNWRIQSSAKVKDTGVALSTPGAATEGWYTTKVPTTVLGALVDNKVYPDPYYGVNMKKIPGYQEGPWLVQKDGSPFADAWWYRTEFKVPPTFQGKNLILHVDGINYRANIWVNGEMVADSGEVVGMFRRFEFDVTKKVHPGLNAIAIAVVPPGLLERKEYKTKQIEATTGWDDHCPQPPDMNVGVWRPVYITASSALRVTNPYVATHLDLPSLDVAHLTVSAYVTNLTDAKVTGKLSGVIEKVKFEQDVALAPHEKRLVTFAPAKFPQLNVKSPRLWWPNGAGAQEMYDIDLSVAVDKAVSDSLHFNFGIREATTYINDEGWRGYRVNGKNILIRGGAWMTSDMLLRLTPQRYDALVSYATNAHLNMLRSEGFSIRELEDFYDACDRHGVMVTQQIFGRNIPDEPLAIACIEDMMLRIRNHPSLVHFLGHDETFPTPTLEAAYKDLIAKYTPERTYQPHSGAFELKDRFQTGGTRTGSREVWTYADPKHYYTSELTGAWGFAQSGGIGGIVASLDSIKKMMPADQLWPVTQEAWSFHTVIQGGTYFDATFKALDRRYGAASGIEDFCKKAYAMNYESARGMLEAYGRNKYSATGITTWKYDVAWPAAMTWAYVDWYLTPTAAYYGAQKACEPLHVQYSYDDDSVWVVNNRYQDEHNLKVTAKVYDFDLHERTSQQDEVSVGADGKTQVFKMKWPDGLSKTFFLVLRMTNGADQPITDNFYWLSTTPDVPGKETHENKVYGIEPKSTADLTMLNELKPAQLKKSVVIKNAGKDETVEVSVENPTKMLAFQVHLAITKGAKGEEVCPTYWSENYFSLLPGERKVVTATVHRVDLETGGVGVRVEGWNVARSDQ